MLCNFYNKEIDQLTSYEIIKLVNTDRTAITYKHLVRFNILMLSDDTDIKVDDYKEDVLPLLDGYLLD